VSARFHTSGDQPNLARATGAGSSPGEPVTSGVASWARGKVLQRTLGGAGLLVAIRPLQLTVP